MALGKRKRTAMPSRRRPKRRMTAKRVIALVKGTVEKSEAKVHRAGNLLGGNYTSVNNDTNQSIVEIGQGNTSSTRVGVNARIVRVYLKFRMHLVNNSGTQNHAMTLRLNLDEVKPGKQDSSTGPPSRGYFSRPDYTEWTKRVLWDKTFKLQPSGDGDMDGHVITYSKMITLKNHKVHWDSASAVQPDNGNLILSAFAETPNGNVSQELNLESDVNVYFSEV